MKSRKNSHRGRHAQIGHHFTVIGNGIGYDAVQCAENDHEELAERMALALKMSDVAPIREAASVKKFSCQRQKRNEDQRH